MLTKPCRCLLADLPDQAALAASIAELIALLPDTLRAEEALRRDRLACCRRCPTASATNARDTRPSANAP